MLCSAKFILEKLQIGTFLSYKQIGIVLDIIFSPTTILFSSSYGQLHIFFLVTIDSSILYSPKYYPDIDATLL